MTTTSSTTVPAAADIGQATSAHLSQTSRKVSTGAELDRNTSLFVPAGEIAPGDVSRTSHGVRDFEEAGHVPGASTVANRASGYIGAKSLLAAPIVRGLQESMAVQDLGNGFGLKITLVNLDTNQDEDELVEEVVCALMGDVLCNATTPPPRSVGGDEQPRKPREGIIPLITEELEDRGLPVPVGMEEAKPVTKEAQVTVVQVVG